VMLLAQAILHDGLVALEDGLLHDPRRTPRRFQALSEIFARNSTYPFSVDTLRSKILR